jgi:hypothetical protein
VTSFWLACQGEHLEQGDYLPGCWVPMVGADFDPTAPEPLISVGKGDLIIVTQSCDLANDKIQLAALCPIATLETWEQLNRDYAKKGFWESVRQGRRGGLAHVGIAYGRERQPRCLGRGLSPDLQSPVNIFAKAHSRSWHALAFAIAISGTLFPGFRSLLHASRPACGNSTVQMTISALTTTTTMDFGLVSVPAMPAAMSAR